MTDAVQVLLLLVVAVFVVLIVRGLNGIFRPTPATWSQCETGGCTRQATRVLERPDGDLVWLCRGCADEMEARGYAS